MNLSALHLGLVLVLVSGSIAYATLSSDRVERPRAAQAAGETDPGLKARGHVKGLFPGAGKVIKVRVRNTTPEPVRIRSVKARALNAGDGCTKDNIKIARRTRNSHRKIPAHGRQRVRVRVWMVADAVDTCEGARFPLHFRVRGRFR